LDLDAGERIAGNLRRVVDHDGHEREKPGSPWRSLPRAETPGDRVKTGKFVRKIPLEWAGQRDNRRGVDGERVTGLLRAWTDGDEAALERLIPLVEGELRRLARAYMRRERQGHTLQTTALVNEAFMRLCDARQIRWNDRAHFLGISARLMRRVLVDHARARGYQKRGGGAQRVTFDEALVAGSSDPSLNVIALDRALDGLAVVEPRQAKVVELRFFGGLSVEETADVLHMSTDTIKRDWRLAKQWLVRELERTAT
jgi:RNA polymerase sigma factor (TIGR02999 family)